MASEACAVDSELTLLYSKMKGKRFPRAGVVPNPFYRRQDAPFTHASFPIYLVTRLAGYDFDDVKGMIDRSLAARNQGKFVFDLKSDDDSEGNNWLRTAGLALPKERVVMDESSKVLIGEKDVIGYAGWGSNDPNRHQRNLGFQWLPGALVSEYVSTDGPHVRAPSRQLDHRHMEGVRRLVRRLAANAYRRLHPRGGHRFFRPGL